MKAPNLEIISLQNGEESYRKAYGVPSRFYLESNHWSVSKLRVSQCILADCALVTVMQLVDIINIFPVWPKCHVSIVAVY